MARTITITEAADRLDDLDYHLARWTSPARLAAHLAGTHDQGVPCAAEDDLAALRALHEQAHAADLAAAKNALELAEDAVAS
jgi:hypothetical protein